MCNTDQPLYITTEYSIESVKGLDNVYLRSIEMRRNPNRITRDSDYKE